MELKKKSNWNSKSSWV